MGNTYTNEDASIETDIDTKYNGPVKPMKFSGQSGRNVSKFKCSQCKENDSIYHCLREGCEYPRLCRECQKLHPVTHKII